MTLVSHSEMGKHRASRKAEHRAGKYPEAVPYFPTRKRLGDPPGFYKNESAMKESQAESTLIQDQLRNKRVSA